MLLLTASSCPLSPTPPLFLISQEGGVGLRHRTSQLPQGLWVGSISWPCLSFPACKMHVSKVNGGLLRSGSALFYKV